MGSKLQLRTSLIWEKKQTSKSRRHRKLPLTKSILRKGQHPNMEQRSWQISETEKILKEAQDKTLITYKGKHIRLATDLSTDTWQARKDRHDIYSILNEKNMQPRIFIQLGCHSKQKERTWMQKFSTRYQPIGSNSTLRKLFTMTKNDLFPGHKAGSALVK